jgi:hypothetical protein
MTFAEMLELSFTRARANGLKAQMSYGGAQKTLEANLEICGSERFAEFSCEFAIIGTVVP